MGDRVKNRLEALNLGIGRVWFQVKGYVIGDNVHHGDFESGVEGPAKREQSSCDSTARSGQGDALFSTETAGRVQNRFHQKCFPCSTPCVDESNFLVPVIMQNVKKSNLYEE